MKIRLLRGNENSALCLRITIDGITKDLDFWRTGMTEVEMVLLQEKLQELFASQMEEIRKVSYARGWNDHKRRKPRATCFPTCHLIQEWERE